MTTKRFSYQISPWLLASGIICLLIMTAALGLSFLDGLPSNPLWWIVFGILSALLSLTIWATALLKRASPIEVVIDADRVEVPDGPLGTQPREIPFGDLNGVRIMTKPSITRRAKPREILYLLYGDHFTLLMSDLFQGHDAYLACRFALCDAIHAANPALPIEYNGERLEDLTRFQQDALPH